jgi:hypothetical protein
MHNPQPANQPTNKTTKHRKPKRDQREAAITPAHGLPDQQQQQQRQLNQQHEQLLTKS